MPPELLWIILFLGWAMLPLYNYVDSYIMMLFEENF